MLINLHNPKLVEITTHDRTSEIGQFHTVQLSEPDSVGVKLNLFIAGDWSTWDAIVNAITEYRQLAAVRALGTEHGSAAGIWAIDGNTTVEHARYVLTGIEEGDPAVMDVQPSPLSGEWADGVTSQDVYRDAGVEIDSLDNNGEPMFGPDNEPSHLLDEYEAAFGTAYWTEVESAARAIVVAAEHADV